jgi:ceramide glucosyltransferase
VLADVVVETALPAYTWREFWQHQLRWAHNIKDRRKSQYFGLIVTFALPWAILAVLAASGMWWTWLALTVAAVTRLVAAYFIGRKVLGNSHVLSDAWLIPLRDFVALGVWIASFLGNTVTWRDDRFRLRDGKLQRIE